MKSLPSWFLCLVCAGFSVQALAVQLHASAPAGAPSHPRLQSGSGSPDVFHEQLYQLQIAAEARQQGLEADISNRQSDLRRLQAQLARMEAIFTDGAIPYALIEQKRWEVDTAQTELDRQRKRVEEAAAEVAMYEAMLHRPPDRQAVAQASVALARRRVELADLGVRQAQRDLQYRQDRHERLQTAWNEGAYPLGAWAEVLEDRVLATDSLGDAKTLAAHARRHLVQNLRRLIHATAGDSSAVTALTAEVTNLTQAADTLTREATELEHRAGELRHEVQQFNHDHLPN